MMLYDKYSPKNLLINNSEQDNIANLNVEAEAIAIANVDSVGIENTKEIRFRKGNNAVERNWRW